MSQIKSKNLMFQGCQMHNAHDNVYLQNCTNFVFRQRTKFIIYKTLLPIGAMRISFISHASVACRGGVFSYLGREENMPKLGTA